MDTIIALLARRAAPGRRVTTTTLLVVTAVGLLVTSYIHWHLWRDEGYRHVPTIGWLFVLQAVSGVVIALAIVAARQLWTAIVGLGFAASTLAGFLLSVTRGFLGFRDSWFAPDAKLAFGVEVAVMVLSLASVIGLLRSSTVARARH